MDIKALRKEYTRLRDIIRKRVSRLKTAGFNEFEKVEYAEYQFKKLRDMPGVTEKQLGTLIKAANKWLAGGTTLKDFRRVQEEAMKEYTIKIPELGNMLNRDFLLFLEEADMITRDKMEYLLERNPSIKKRMELISEITQDYMSWLLEREV